MKMENINSLVRGKNIVIPLYIYRLMPKLDIELSTFVFLMYLYNKGEKIVFDPGEASMDYGKTIPEIMEYIDELTKKKLISFTVTKNNKNVTEEYLSLSYFYEKISLLLMENINSNESIDSNIFELIEKEFGRVLSPIEYEIIKAWSESNYSDELIKEALKEAVFNGVNNLRYIDKILYEWSKKGLKNKEDIEKNRMNHKEKNKNKVEVFEYNWLDDEE